eukprot:CAMPEP_0194181030 /NCGR_PEP_ID=MMETSP0154-20130528/18804_1 /TAXON_ID=1049557 /ORGANISM="Thalassiothrix antarctica, Strain L6-D1" /LENGTH=95 /DNA_ID=CAMNT_0038896891 /DNA_START=165 /DNA_END=452 /DNA_ORIENTATION=-
MADINGDGKPDIVGFGDDFVYTSLNKGDGIFTTPKLVSNWLGTTKYPNDIFPRIMVDMNGDGKADIVWFGSKHVYIYHSNGDGTFDSPIWARTYG